MRKDVKTLGQILSGLGDLLDGLSNFAETGADVLQTVGTKPGRAGGVTYGWSINTMTGPRRSNAGAAPVTPRAATAVQECFDEGEFVRAVIELPGVVNGDIQFTVKGQELIVEAQRHGGRSVIRLRVPAAVSAEGATSSYRNGIFEILLPKRRGPHGSR